MISSIHYKDFLESVDTNWESDDELKFKFNPI